MVRLEVCCFTYFTSRLIDIGQRLIAAELLSNGRFSLIRIVRECQRGLFYDHSKEMLNWCGFMISFEKSVYALCKKLRLSSYFYNMVYL